MKIMVLEDEYSNALLTRNCLHSILPFADIQMFCNPNKLLEASNKQVADIYYIGIELVKSNGIEVAETLLEKNPLLNIVFVSKCEDYKSKAMDLYASDYIVRPVSIEKIRDSISHLRYPIVRKKFRYYAKTFGNFTFYIDNKPASFQRNKSRELLAYLIDRNGAVVSRKELTLMLFEDETHSRRSQKNLSNAYYSLMQDLKALKASEIIVNNANGLAINKETVQSDLYEYFDGNLGLYKQEYMEQYSWGENFKSLNYSLYNNNL